MANSWLRLWHDMPNDPKWRTIAKISGQPIALVQAVYLQLLVSASQNTITDEAGVTLHVVTVTNEDISSALDVTEMDVASVTSAMQGRVLSGNTISGWNKRQANYAGVRNNGKPAKTNAQRVREHRERKKQKELEKRNVTTSNVTETLGNDVTPQIREEEIREEVKDKTPHNAQAREGDSSSDNQPFQMFDGWSPSGLSQQEYTPAELEDFVLFWSAGGQEFNQAQWDQKFGRSVQRYREHAKTKKSGGSHAKQNTGNASAFEQVRARHNEWRISQGLAPLGDDDEAVWPQVDPEERGGTIHDLDPDDFTVLG